jgi:7-cyano-7-deazaguanine synthase
MSEAEFAAPLRGAAMVCFSGGQDSTTCLAWALDRFERVETVGFDYGQRHAVELECRRRVREKIVAIKPQWAARLGEDHMLDMKLLGQISDCSLTRDKAIEFEKNGVPNTFVPGRNLLFFTFAAALAYRRGVGTLIGGMCETDYSGYADCRDNTLKSLQVTLSLGLDVPMRIETPLMWLTKGETWELAHTIGGDALVSLIVEETHTCYMGDRSRRHDWGYGCGECPACRLRAKGWEEYCRRHAAPGRR